MKTWKRNVIVGAVLLFVCAGIYLNWLNGQNKVSLTDTLDADKVMGDSTLVMSTELAAGAEETAGAEEAAASEGLEANTEGVSASEYFASVRLSRQEARDNAVDVLQEAMSYDDENEASAASTQLGDIVDTSLQEAQIESLIMAKGYEECVAYMTDGLISVAVSAPEAGLQTDDVALISDVITSQSDYDLTQIRIIEVK